MQRSLSYDELMKKYVELRDIAHKQANELHYLEGKVSQRAGDVFHLNKKLKKFKKILDFSLVTNAFLLILLLFSVLRYFWS